MIDLKRVRENPEAVRESQRARGEDPALVDELLAADEARRSAIQKADELRSEQKAFGKKIGQAGVPLVPCVMWGSQRIWTKDLPKHFRNVPVIVRYGEPVHLTGDAEADTAELKRQMHLLLDASRSEYASLYSDGAGEAWMPVALGGTAPTPEEAEELYARERAEREAKKQRKKV